MAIFLVTLEQGRDLGHGVARPATVATGGWSGYGGLATAGYDHAPLNLAATWGDASLCLRSGVVTGMSLGEICFW